MIKHHALAACLALTACASPSLEFRQSSKDIIMIGGDKISVFWTDQRAQAIRTNTRGLNYRTGAQARLLLAIEKVTGCTVKPRSIDSDDVVMTAAIDCGRGSF